MAALFDTIAHCDVEQWLDENHPDLHRLFAFVRGDPSALRSLKHRKVTCKRLAEILRPKYRDYHEEDEDGAALAVNGPAQVPEGAAADVGCLIGEMHLHNDEFDKAVEAFSRAVETNPTADAYEGRARAIALSPPSMKAPRSSCASQRKLESHPDAAAPANGTTVGLATRR